MYFIKKGGFDMLKREDIIAMAKDAKVEFIRLQFTDILGVMKNVCLLYTSSGEKKRRGRKIRLLIGFILVLVRAAVLIINAVVLNAGERIISPADAAELQADCILVLGCLLYTSTTGQKMQSLPPIAIIP